jgi:hypothetical protein
MVQSTSTNESGAEEDDAMAITNLVDSALIPSATSSTDEPADDTPPSFPVGTKVEVRRKFDDKWAGGCGWAEPTPHETKTHEIRLRRLSDGEVIPVPFSADDVRKERKRKNWWY